MNFEGIWKRRTRPGYHLEGSKGITEFESDVRSRHITRSPPIAARYTNEPIYFRRKTGATERRRQHPPDACRRSVAKCRVPRRWSPARLLLTPNAAIGRHH